MSVRLVESGDSIDPVLYIQEDINPARISTDIVIQNSAGSALAHALYHSGAAYILALPDPVIRAYANACRAYRIGSGNNNE